MVGIEADIRIVADRIWIGPDLFHHWHLREKEKVRKAVM